MLQYSKTARSPRFQCPYCGRFMRVRDADTTIDHIVPKSMWQGMRDLDEVAAKYDYRISTVNDFRNRIYCCKRCNSQKGFSFIVPSWNATGECKFFDIEDLRLYATYFHYWSNCFKVFFTQVENNGYSQSDCDRYVQEIDEFELEYKGRVAADNWAIDGVS